MPHQPNDLRPSGPAPDDAPVDDLPLDDAPAHHAARRRTRNRREHPNRKGGREATRQNFSMHPDLMRAIFTTADQMNVGRSESILLNRSLRVTYSKVVAALAWLLKTRYLDEQGRITPRLRKLIADYEASPLERPDDDEGADLIMTARRVYAASLPAEDEEWNKEAEEAGHEKAAYEDKVDGRAADAGAPATSPATSRATSQTVTKERA